MQSVAFFFCLLFASGFLQRTSLSDRTFTFINSCGQDLYVGSQGNPLPAGGGFLLADGQRISYIIAGSTTATRFWARTGCQHSDGILQCETGNCPLPPVGYTNGNDGTQCVVASDGTQIGGIPPATLAEFTLGGASGNPYFPDFYDLSLVDGYNLPIQVVPLGGMNISVGGPFSCGSTACNTFDTAIVPPELQYKDSEGRVYAVASVCTAIYNVTQRDLFPDSLGYIWNAVDPHTGFPMKDLVCCSCGEGNGGCSSTTCEYGCSPYNLPSPNELGGKCNVDTWPLASNGQRYDQVFSNQCEDAYSWQFDDHQATFQCIYPDYEITFCANGALAAQLNRPTAELTVSSQLAAEITTADHPTIELTTANYPTADITISNQIAAELATGSTQNSLPARNTAAPSTLGSNNAFATGNNGSSPHPITQYAENVVPSGSNVWTPLMALWFCLLVVFMC